MLVELERRIGENAVGRPRKVAVAEMGSRPDKPPSAVAVNSPVPSRRALADQLGFTLVELMVAIFILLIGLLGVAAMLNHATRVAGTNNGRVAATNLAREILEDARSIDYELLNPAQIAGALQGRPGIGGSGNPWTLNRRGVDYSAQVNACTVDQPKDGLAATPPQNACPRATAIPGAPAETNPDDFRNVTVVLTWNDRGRSRMLTQSSLIANPAGGLGPRIVAFPEPVHITDPAQAQVRWDGTVKTSDANAVRWAADDADSQGVASRATRLAGRSTGRSPGTSGPTAAEISYTTALTPSRRRRSMCTGLRERADWRPYC